MKAAKIFGDLSSDKTDEQYPEVAFCGKCFNKLMEDQENSGIVHEVPYDPELHGDCCSICDCEDC
ncbi:hypothetical protein [Fundidesulfovibrio terrae]|uniref:hypothetical protein n=1 Tax=Fundidesulfovibrio terrae TaxID=2922866 RepID=UPI001FAEA09B|nr:hypothetical protein [Fundidesulfovibrio terrae]